MDFSIISIVAIAVVLLTAYIWLTRGFFSALLNLMCTIVAGAIAFAVWEPVSLAILEASSADGFLESCAWGFGLAFPFAISLTILRLVVDRTLRANVIISDAANYAGGGILGAGAGFITAGIIAISLSFFRVDYLGAKSFEYDPAGNLVRKGQMWVPFDKWVAAMYGGLSERSFRTDQPLARWHPQLHEAGNSMRLTAFDQKGRNVLKAEDFKIIGRFTVGKGSSASVEELGRDAWDKSTPSILDPDGKPFPAGTHLEGIMVNFSAGSKEADGRTAVGAGQVRLVLENPTTSERMTVFPVAVSSQAAPETPGVARWRYNASGTFIASIGGASESLFAFEFPCPPGYEPIAIYVKGMRANIGEGMTAKPQFEFASSMDRDRAIATTFGANPGAGIVGAAGTGASTSSGLKPTAPLPGFEVNDAGVLGTIARGNSEPALPEFRIGNNLPLVLQKGQEGGLQLTEENVVISGELYTTLESMPKSGGLEKGLRIEKLQPSADVNIVWMDVGASSRTSLLGRSLDAALAVMPPTLIDTQGERYEPVGYLYTDETDFKLAYNPGQPIRSMSQLPTLSKSRPKQKLTLIFRVSFGREVKYFAMGPKVLNEFTPPIPMRQNQMR